MTRVEIDEAVFLSSAGIVSTVRGASVQVNIRGGGAATVYDAEVGGSPLSNPLTTDIAGRINGWVDAGSYDLVVSGSSITSYTQPYEAAAVGPTGPAGPPGVGASWKGVWSSGTTYAVADGVYRNGAPYISNAGSNLNHDPATDTGTNWGALGSSAFGVDVWNTQASPGTVTDWGPIVNTLITNGARRLLFGEHTFPFSTQITNQNAQAVSFNGAGGWLHPWYRGSSDAPPSRLLWKGGAASGNAIVLDHDGHILRDIAVLYDTAAYDGTLVRFSSPSFQCGRCAMVNTLVGSLTDGVGYTNATGVDVTNGVGIVITRTTFNGLKDAYACRLGGVLSDDMIMHDVTFQNCSQSYIRNLPRNGSFRNLVFYGYSFIGHGTQPDNFIWGDTSNTLGSPSECTFENIWSWDQVAPSVGTYSRLVSQPSTQDWRVKISNVFTWEHQLYWFNGPGAVQMDNVSLSNSNWSPGQPSPIDLGDPTTAFKSTASIKNLRYPVSLDGPTPVVNIAGHGMVDIDTARPAVRTLSGQERVGYENPNTTASGSLAQPTIAINAGATNTWVASIGGTDTAGWIALTIGNVNQAAGLLADITFNMPALSPSGNASNISSDGNMRVRVPAVVISPFEKTGWQTAGASSAAGAYVRVTGGTTSGFSIGVANTIPANAILGFAYRVIQL